jgi:hypothetical protein
MSEIKKIEAADRPGAKSPVVRTFADVLSFIFHPVFMPTLLVLILYRLSPTSFAGVPQENLGKWLVIVAINTIAFPLLTVALLKGLGFIQSIYMHDPKDRIIPLIGTMIFYFWAYNVFKNLETPFVLRTMLLGTFWGVILLFLINIFFKVSMHTSAAGNVLGLMIVLMMISPVNMLLPFFLSIVAAGIIGTARLALGAHKPSEIWLGYVLGILVQVAAYIYLK